VVLMSRLKVPVLKTYWPSLLTLLAASWLFEFREI
jgi:hypothetical protein